MNGIIGVVANIILSVALSKVLGIFGVAIASTIASMITAVLLFISTRKLVGDFDVFPMIKLLKILLSAIVMLFVLTLLNNKINLNNAILSILLNGIVGAIIYFIACKILRIEEFNEVIDMIKNKLSKRGI